MGQVIESDDDGPAIHLALIDLLRAVIEAAGIAEPDRVRGREQPKGGVRPDHLRLVEQSKLARHLEHALDHEHHVGAAGVVLVEAQRRVGLQRVRQNALAEFGDLLAVLDDDGVLADKVDAAHMAVEIDAHARPVEPRRHLLDMGRLAGAVIALDHHPPVVLEARENGERHFPVKEIIGVDIGHVLIGLGICGDVEIGVDTEDLAHGNRHIRQAGAIGSFECHDR